MIDTDRYEGHTEGPWKWLKDSLLLKGKAYATNRDAYCDSFIISHRHLDGDWPIDNKANAQLIADAPLLLEEVKRLREGIEKLANSMEISANKGKNRMSWPTRLLWVDALKELIE